MARIASSDARHVLQSTIARLQHPPPNMLVVEQYRARIISGENKVWPVLLTLIFGKLNIMGLVGVTDFGNCNNKE